MRNQTHAAGFIDLPMFAGRCSTFAVAGKIQFMLGRLLLLAMLAGETLDAAQLDLRVQTSPTVVTTNRDLTYFLAVTNQSGFVLSNVVVNATFNAPISLTSATNTQGSATVDGSVIVFRIAQMAPASTAPLTLVVQPLAAGLLTNRLSYLANGVTAVETNVVNFVFAAEANLGIRLLSETNALVTGDWTRYRVVVTNAGPERAPELLVTSQLPVGWQFLSFAPSNAPADLSGTQLVLRAASLGVGSNVFFDVSIQASTAGTNLLNAFVEGREVTDPVAADNAVTNIFEVVNPLTGVLAASVVSTQFFNPQTGLMEQTIRLTNPNDFAVAGARVAFPGITQRVFNAAGTNAGQPFVALTRALLAGESVDLFLEYFVPSRTAFSDPTITALAVPTFAPVAPIGVEVPINRWARLPDGALLLEIPAEPGRAYLITYGGDAAGTNRFRALPAVVAPGDRLQWIDEGPPKTSRRPGEVPARFYRVIQAE